MADYSGLDWSRIRFAPPAPCPHGLSGAPYCAACLDRQLTAAAEVQQAERIIVESEAARRALNPERYGTLLDPADDPQDLGMAGSGVA